MHLWALAETSDIAGRDSGALLTTCASSGATLVAIVAGFGLTRYLTLSSEIGAAANLVRDLEARAELLADELAQAKLSLNRRRLDWEFDSRDVVAAIFGVESITIDDGALKDRLVDLIDDFGNYTDAETAEVIADWRQEARSVLDHPMWDEVPVAADFPSWDDFRQGRGVRTNHEILWSEHYIEIKRRRYADWAARTKATTGIPPGPLRNVSDFLGPSGQKWAAVSGSHVRRVEAAEDAVRRVEAELDVARDRRSRISQPKGIVGSLVWLAIIFVLTVVPSMLLLAPEPRNLTREQSAAVLGAFFLGVGVMFVYFIGIARSIRTAS